MNLKASLNAPSHWLGTNRVLAAGEESVEAERGAARQRHRELEEARLDQQRAKGVKQAYFFFNNPWCAAVPGRGGNWLARASSRF
jgi:hypothetical protein